MKISQAKKPASKIILDMLSAPDEYFTREEVYKEVQKYYPTYSFNRIAHYVDNLEKERRISILRVTRLEQYTGSHQAIKALKKVWGIKEDQQ